MFPESKSQKLIDELKRYVVMSPLPFALDLAACHGMWLQTVDGQRIFDWSGYYGSKLIGHNHPGLSEPDYLRHLALAANNKLPNPDFLTSECLEYYRLLYRVAPRCMQSDTLEVYAVNSGAEAVENMLKYLIRLYDQRQETEGRPPGLRRLIYFENAFHGRTVFTLNITRLDHDLAATQNYQNFIPVNLRTPFPCVNHNESAEWNEANAADALRQVEQLLQQYGEEVVAIIFEPLQGAGGQHVAPVSFYQGLSELAHRYGSYLAVDEVQTAGGQCGALFAVDLFDLPHPPQAVAVAKKFGNGAVYMRESAGDIGVLDSTWGGTLADMVRTVQEFKIVERERLIEQVPAKAERLVNGLRQLESWHGDLISNVRGLGLYQGFSVRDPETRNQLKQVALDEQQTLLLGAGRRSIRLRPVLDVTFEDIDRLLDKLARCLTKL